MTVIKFNIKFFPPDKISTGKNHVLHVQQEAEEMAQTDNPDNILY
jgi:hypothetical protein